MMKDGSTHSSEDTTSQGHAEVGVIHDNARVVTSWKDVTVTAPQQQHAFDEANVKKHRLTQLEDGPAETLAHGGSN